MPKPSFPQWLETAVFYEIYPPSFADSNGDGIGDLRGIIDKLDYVQSLGCNALWLNPFYESPFRDGGYDVTDHYAVAARYGTPADARELLAECRRRGIRVLLDLVPGHTSNQHPWFIESAKATPGPYSDYYVWTNTVWQSVPHGDAISGFGERYGKYLTNFFWFQPALNYGYAEPDPRHPWQQPLDAPGPKAVRAELELLMRHWLREGASGFRVDMAGSLIKGGGPAGEKATRDLWSDIRAWMERDFPDSVLISEWGHPPSAIGSHFHMDFVLPFIADGGWHDLFSLNEQRDNDIPHHPLAFFDERGQGDASKFFEYYGRMTREVAGRGLVCFPSGNHDTSPRIGTERGPEALKCILAFILGLPGAPFIYYGDEIGLRYIPGLTSKEGGYNRTNARTPMQWGTGPNAGFSTASADRLYLPVDPRPDRPTVEAQEADPTSPLNLVRKLSRLRQAHRALCAWGDMRPLHIEKNGYPIVFLRSHPDAAERVVCAFNPRREPARLTIDLDFPPSRLAALHTQGADATLSGRKLTLTMAGVSFGWWALA